MDIDLSSRVWSRFVDCLADMRLAGRSKLFQADADDSGVVSAGRLYGHALRR